MKSVICDTMTVALAREIKKGETVFQGVSSPMPMVAILLARHLKGDSIIYLNVAGGINAVPEELNYSTDGPNMVEQSEALFCLADIFDLSMRGLLDVVFLSGVQIGKRCHLNSSVIGPYDNPKVRLPGGAGSAVLAPTAKRAIIWRTRHDKKSFVEQPDFITFTGNIDAVITPLCIFRNQQGELVLQSIHPFSSLEEVRMKTGFDIPDKKYPLTPAITPEESKGLDRVDPDRIREIEMA